MTDLEVIAAIKANHLKVNVTFIYDVGGRLDWGRAWVDPGNTLFGLGPYAKVPTTHDDTVIRVYPPERLRKKLAAQWEGMPK